MKKQPIIAIAVLLLLGLVVWMSLRQQDQKSQNPDGKLKVVASFYPLAHFTQQIGGAHVEVQNLTPPGAEPHDYEPTPRQIADLYDSDAVITQGIGIDTWISQLKTELLGKDVAVLIMLEDNGNDHQEVDPHTWLSPRLAQVHVEIIRDLLIQEDPTHEADYRANAAAYVAQLQQLDQRYATGLANCQLKEVVVSHAVMHYLNRDYGFSQISIAGLSPEDEPSTQQLAEIAKFVKEKDIKHIFFETLVSPELAQTVATETGAQIIVFNPLEGLTEEELAAGQTYISVMESNLGNLQKGLQCS